MLAPNGSYLSFDALVPLAGVVLAPSVLTLGPALTLNFLKFLLPIACALTGRRLARELGLDRTAAWISGALYGFSTIVDWRTQYHLNFGFALPFVPLVVLYTARYDRTRERRPAVLAGVTLGLIILTDPTMALFAVLAALSYVIVALVADRDWGLWIRGLATAAAVALLVGSPQLAMMARAATNGGYSPNHQALAATWTATGDSIDTMLSPANVRAFVPGDLGSLGFQHQYGEASPMYGWGLLGLCLGALLLTALGRRVPIVRGRVVAWALVLAITASVLALGPEITVSHFHHIPLTVHRYGQALSGLMPYTWLTSLPFFGDVRVPARFTMLGILPLTILAGIGVAALRERGWWGVGIVAALLAFALAESGFPDGGASKAWVPITRDRLYAPIKADHTRSTVVDVPLGFLGATDGAGSSHGEEPLLRATQHGHPVATGWVTRMTPSTLAPLVAHPFYSDVLSEQPPTASGTPAPAIDASVAIADAKRLKVGWAVVWPDANRRVIPFLKATGFRYVLSDDGIELYRFAPRR